MDERRNHAHAIANVLLDLVAAVDTTGESPALPIGWAQPFAQELSELEAVVREIDDDFDPPRVTYNITPLLGSTAGLLEKMIRIIANHQGVDRLTVINDLRRSADFLDD